MTLVLRSDEATSHLDCILEVIQEATLKAEQAVRIEPAGTMRAQDFIRPTEPIGTNDLAGGLIPQEEVKVVGVKRIQVDFLSRSFTNCLESDLSEAAYFLQSQGNFPGSGNENLQGTLGDHHRSFFPQPVDFTAQVLGSLLQSLTAGDGSALNILLTHSSTLRKNHRVQPQILGQATGIRKFFEPVRTDHRTYL
jgi:hypothetical protein